jgi:hypothetical protein
MSVFNATKTPESFLLSEYGTGELTRSPDELEAKSVLYLGYTSVQSRSKFIMPASML